MESGATKICAKAQMFRDLARQHQIGSDRGADLDYISRQKALHSCSTFQKQDNLLVPSPSKLLHETTFSLAVGTVKDIHTSPSMLHFDSRANAQVSQRQLGVSSAGIERNLPLPPNSLFVILPPGVQAAPSPGGTMRGGRGGGGKQPKPIILEPEYVGLLLRSYMLRRLSDTELRFIFEFLFSLMPNNKLLNLYQEKALEIFQSFLECTKLNLKADPRSLQRREAQLKNMTARTDLRLRDMADLDLSRLGSSVITLESSKQNPLKLGQTYTKKWTIRNRKKRDCKFKILRFSGKKSIGVATPKQAKARDYDLQLKASAPMIRKGSGGWIELVFTAHRPIRILDELIVIDIEGGRRIYLCLHLHVESKVFGIDPVLLEHVHVEGIGDIPRVLEYMKSELLRKGALTTVGIFRKAGHERRMMEIRKAFDAENYLPCENVNDFATLIKVWFRNLPTKVLSFYPTDYFQKLDANSMAACMEALNGLPEMSRNLINWLLTFMVDVVEHSEVNKMTSSNLAIVFSPNLYKVHSKHPGTLMMMTSKMSQFFQTLVELRESQLFEDVSDDDGYSDDDDEYSD